MTKTKTKTYKVGNSVNYVTQGGIEGFGKIVDIREGARGAWYVINDPKRSKPVSVRLAGIVE